jgi:hypothetical protein
LSIFAAGANGAGKRLCTVKAVTGTAAIVSQSSTEIIFLKLTAV